VSGEQLPAVNTWVKLMEINCKYVQWLHFAQVTFVVSFIVLSKRAAVLREEKEEEEKKEIE
jgi:hypothetical protein